MIDGISKVLVVGAGQMGQGIAWVCAAAGYAVELRDRSAAVALAGRGLIEKGLTRSVKKGKLSDAEAEQLLDRIQALGPDAPVSADVAIEAVSEQFALKRAIFEDLDARLPELAPLFSNTSSISITRLAAVTKRPGRVLGMHFMNPVPVMQLVELVVGVRTSDETLSLATTFAQDLGKTVVTSKDRPGFIVNRVLVPMLNEACFALQEGVANIENIDLGVQLGLNHPMGPLALADLIGLDTVLFIAEVLHSELGDDKYRPAGLLRNLVAAGYLGRKTGRGFYDYSGPDKVPAKVV